MVAFRGGMEFRLGRPMRLPPPPETLPAQPIRLLCPERPEVQAGQLVKQGQVLLQPARAGHGFQVSPVSGTVRQVTPIEPVETDKARGEGTSYEVTVQPEGDRVETTLPIGPPRGRRLEAWFAALRQVGVWTERDGEVGLLPQLESARNRRPDTVVCVGLDAFPPYPDRGSLLASFPDDAVLGTIILADLVGAKRTSMLAARSHALRARLGPACRNYSVPLTLSANHYPAADPTMVAWGHAGRRRLAHLANPVSRGLMLIHPWTAIRVGRWFTLRRFDLSRPMLLAWPEAAAAMSSAYALPGQPLASLDPRLARRLEVRPQSVLIGNPMTGRPAAEPALSLEPSEAAPPSAEAPAAPPPRMLSEPVVPESDLLITVLPELRPAAPEPCVSCGWCAEVCPTRLRPIDLAQLAHSRRDDERLIQHLPWCIDCGLCSHVCPSSIPLAQTLRSAAVGLLHQKR